MWVALCATAVVLVALIVFLLQNTRTVQVSFLWMDGSAPLAITLLIAAVGAALMTALLGTVRITQLRRVARRRPASHRHKRGSKF
ncbi:lipopolysaccharide assembly protein LapA domain-containing protein [Kribbella sp. NPDC023972]|uniref:LapA family protein n=1 Tax=Kribbella sp. NPDC023972 TaxID=3154795 RepID=UPI0034113F8C